MHVLHLQLTALLQCGERERHRRALLLLPRPLFVEIIWKHGRLTSNLPDDQQQQYYHQQSYVEIPLETFQQLWAAFLNPWWWLRLLLKGCPCWKKKTKTRKSSPKAIGNKIQYRCLWTFFYALIPEKLIVFLKIRQSD